MCDNPDYFYHFIDDHIQLFGLNGVTARSIVYLIDGYKGRGYALSTEEELSKFPAFGCITLLDSK